MNFRDRFYKPLLVALASIMFFGAGRIQNLLNADRKQFGFTRLEPLQNAPPILAFTTVALGGFRGLISNALWMRLNQLQDEERYFEMVQLSDWITKLEPHFATVWVEQAWNMAYNISVKCKDFNERWRWVQRGTELLYEGLKYNPHDVNIYKELAWFYRHKIGDNLDDANMLYKFNLAVEMQDVLGGRPDFEALINPQTSEDRLRAKKLTEDFHMDPKIVEEVDKQFGPLDWRLPDATALYWTEMGVRNGDKEDTELIRRFPYQIMQKICLGQSALPPSVKRVTRENFILWPNTAMIPHVNEVFMQCRHDEPELEATIKTAQKNFLQEAVVLLWEFNHTQEASHWFSYLKENFTNAFAGMPADIDLDTYAFDQIQGSIKDTDPAKTTATVLGLISQEYTCMIVGQEEQAINFRDKAASIWNFYQKRLPREQRVAIQTFEKLQQYELEAMQSQVGPQQYAFLLNQMGQPKVQPSSTNSPPATGVQH